MYARDGMNDLALVYRAVIEPCGPAHLANGIELHSSDGLPWSNIRNRSEYAIVRRYFRERATRGFGIYAGTDERGSVAMVSAPYTTPPDAMDSTGASSPDRRHR
jgi:flavin-dependent trigonelline monooxygenase, reductase component